MKPILLLTLALVLLAPPSSAQTVEAGVFGVWQRPCLPLGCGTGCTSQAVFGPLNTDVITWGTPIPGSTKSSARFIGIRTRPLPLGQVVEVGSMSIVNGSTQDGTEIGTAVLALGQREGSDPFAFSVPLRSMCVLNTLNRTGNPRRDGDFYFLRGFPFVPKIPEGEDSVIPVFGELREVISTVVEHSGESETSSFAPEVPSEPKFELVLTGFGEPSGGGELVPWLPMSLDVKPGSCPNPLNLRDIDFFDPDALSRQQGVTPVAILGTEELDVRRIDVDSLELVYGVGIPPLRHSYEDVATPYGGELCGCSRAGGDGVEDLVLHFDTQSISALVQGFGIRSPDEVVLAVQAETTDGALVQAGDCVSIRDKRVNRRGRKPAMSPQALREVFIEGTPEIHR